MVIHDYWIQEPTEVLDTAGSLKQCCITPLNIIPLRMSYTTSTPFHKEKNHGNGAIYDETCITDFLAQDK